VRAAEPAKPRGVHRRPVAPVATPTNREELLQRLRGRAHSGPGTANGSPTKSARKSNH
jgi:hypothetical protein